MNMAKHLTELRLAVGDVTLASAKAEQMLEGLLVGLEGSHDETVLARYRTMASLISRCERLLNDREDLHPNHLEALSLLEELNALKDKRNRFVHDVVLVHPIQGGKANAPKFERLPSPWRSSHPRTAFEVAELRALATEFERISMSMFAWSYDNLPYLRA